MTNSRETVGWHRHKWTRWVNARVFAMTQMQERECVVCGKQQQREAGRVSS